MKTIFKNQENFIDTLQELDSWTEKFNYFLELSDMMSAVCPEDLLPFRVDGCISRTYFRAWLESGYLRVAGWSNTGTQRGIIVSMMEMFDRIPVQELTDRSDIYFHKQSDLINNLTPLRQAGLTEMIARIHVLFPPAEQD